MADHDPRCPARRSGPTGCRCGLIAQVRADERERIAQAIEAKHDQVKERPPHLIWDWWVGMGMADAAQIARNGGRDE